MANIGYGITPPQPGLVPIGDTGFYATPNTPADPTDCSRYPSSFFCGGGLRLRPNSITVSPVLDNCNIGVALGGSLAFIGIPSFQIVYRFPDCRATPDPTPLLPPNTPLEIAGNSCGRNDPLFVIMPIFTMNYAGSLLGGPSASVHYESLSFDLIEIQRDVPHGLRGRSGLAVVDFCKFSVTKSLAYSRDYLLQRSGGHDPRIPVGADINFVYTDEETQVITFAVTHGNSYYLEPYLESDLDFINSGYGIGDYSAGFNRIPFSVFPDYDDFINYIRQRDGFFNTEYHASTDYYVTQLITSSNQQPVNVSITTPYGTFTAASNGIVGGFYGQYYRYQGSGIQAYQASHTTFTICNNYNRVDPPPPPPEEKCCKENDLACCPDNSDLLKAILAKLNTLSMIVGVADYPASLPQSLITKNGKNPGNISIPSLTQLLGWYIQRFDEVIGQFEIDLDVAKPDEAGETIPIRLPNLAESIAEMMTLAFQTSINSELLVNICNRTLIETGQQKQQEFKNYMAIQSIIEWLGFGTEETSETMPLSFTPGETSFSKMLVESQVSVKGTQFDGKQGFHGSLLDLLQAAAIIRAIHWRKVDQTKDVAAQLFNSILAAKTVKDALFNHDDCLNFDINQLINDNLKPTVNKSPDLTVTPATVTPSTGDTGG